MAGASSSSPAGPDRRSGVDAANCCRDETLIDLDELPPPAASSRIAGEVLGAGMAWRPDEQPESVDPASVGLDEFDTGPPVAIDTAADDAELGRSLDELTGPS